jgi:hypothetical protein
VEIVSSCLGRTDFIFKIFGIDSIIKTCRICEF